MERMAMVIGIKPENIPEYKRIHANTWAEILAGITACNIRNYSIYLKEPENLLFGYWEYHGSDFVVDSAKMAADPKTQAWWDLCMPMQEPLDSRKEDEWWAIMEEVFHHD